MDAAEIRQLKPKLRKFLELFADCMVREPTRKHLQVYVQGLLSTLDRKSVEPIALAANVSPRTLQQFLSFHVWDQGQLIDTLQRHVAQQHAEGPSIGLIDETSCPKKGDMTPGVQRQWCGATGKKDNCVTTVHLGYGVGDFHCLLDSELFLPESWSEDRPRCRAAAIPDAMHHQAKWRTALDLYDRARANGVIFSYLTFDELYGGKPEYLRELSARSQHYVGEVPRSFVGWLKAPRVVTRPFRRGGRGRGRAVPRLAADSAPARSVEYFWNWSAEFQHQPWTRWRVKDTEKGPLVWETKHARLTIKDAHGLPGETLHLIVARNVCDTSELKFFVSNAPEETPLSELLHVAFSRWRVERCFEDQKTELGFDHFEGRSYVGLKRHQAIAALSHLFLSEVRAELGGKKSGTDRLPGADGDGGLGPLVERGARRGQGDSEQGRGRHRLHAAPQRPSEEVAHQEKTPQTPGARRPHNRPAPLRLELELAL